MEKFAPLLLLVGLVGLHVRVSARPGVIEKIGFWVALVRLVLVVAGEVSLYYLIEDAVYIMTDPAWRSPASLICERSLPPLYSPEYVEEVSSEVRLSGVLQVVRAAFGRVRSCLHSGKDDPQGKRGRREHRICLRQCISEPER